MTVIHINGAEVGDEPEALEAWLCDAVALTLRSSGVEEGEISVTLLDDEAIQELNTRYLGHEYPTDVISFGLHGEGEPPLGDIYIGFQQACVQAEERDLPLREECARLVIHGTLHLLGHEHPEGPNREESELYRLQESLLSELVEARS